MSEPATMQNYPRNIWWVAAERNEVTSVPVRRVLLDTPVALYRTGSGDVAALYDRCIHRWAPLSAGFVEGDELVCGYHGARFGADGRCRLYPTQPSVPSTAKVQSFATLERGPFIWIWLGDDAAREAADLPPDFGWATDPAWTVVLGRYELAANYMLLHENVLDLTHSNYLHRDSFKITNRQPPEYRVEGNQVFSHLRTEVDDLTETDRIAMGMGDPFALSQEDEAIFVSPAVHSHRSVTTRTPNPHLPEAAVMLVNHILTPISPNRCHYWWLIGTDMPMPPEAGQFMAARIEIGFLEDKAMLEAIQLAADTDPCGRNYLELSFNGDAGGIQARRALERILVMERDPA